MNVLKNFEAVFVVALGLACATSFALDTSAPKQTATASTMQVVVVSAKRLSAEQKQQSLIDERNAMLAAAANSASKM